MGLVDQNGACLVSRLTGEPEVELVPPAAYASCRVSSSTPFANARA